jgi:hypothetical protein
MNTYVRRDIVAHASKRTRANTYDYIIAHIHNCARFQTHAHTHTHTHTYTHTHTHTRTPTGWSPARKRPRWCGPHDVPPG